MSLRHLIYPLVSMLPLALAPAAFAGPVNVNSADAAEIAKELKGIGLAKAKAIVDYREKNGPFKTADDLRKVKGFGPKVLERNRPNIRTNNSKGAKAPANDETN